MPGTEQFTRRARKVMQLAGDTARNLNHEYIGTEHMLLGLLEEGDGVGANALKNLDLDLKKVREEVLKLIKREPGLLIASRLPQTPRAKKVIEYAIEEARNLNHNYVGTEHLLLGLLREHEGVAAQVLMNLGLKLKTVREEVLNLLGAGPESPTEPSTAGVEMKGQDATIDSLERAFNAVGQHLLSAVLSLSIRDRLWLVSGLRHIADGLEKLPPRS